MSKRSDQTLLADTLGEVFLKVLSFQNILIEEAVEPPCLSSETVAASLNFSGDYTGCFAIILRSGDYNSAARMLLERFSVDLPPESYPLAFSETLNILAGNLATALSQRGKELQIFSPDTDAQSFSTDPLPVLKYAVGDITFKFILPKEGATLD